MNLPEALPSRLKAIPPARDRLQSRLLLWTVSPLLCWLAATTLYQIHAWSRITASRSMEIFWAITISAVFAFAAWRLRAATPAAAVCGGLVCLLLIESNQRIQTMWLQSPSILRSGVVPLAALFAFTFASTKAGHRRKASAGLAEHKKGRNAAQIVANLGVAGIVSVLAENAIAPHGWDFTGSSAAEARQRAIHSLAGLFVPALAALAEATADTVSSEIGQAFGGTPCMLLTLRPAAPGTDGAITLLGTFAGIASAALVALTGMPALGMSFAQCSIAFAAGTAGLFFDSLLGATLERRGWLGNNLVNFLSTAFAAGVSLALLRLTLA